MRLEDKVAIVTGAAHGMGEAEARLFAQEGAKVVVADVLGEQAEAVAADIRSGGGEAIAAPIDVTSEPAWVALIEKTIARYGRLDILVNNAGISGSSVGDPDGLEGWHRIIAVNQTSVFLGTKLAAEQMAKTGGGSIVNISSIMGFVGDASGHPAYSASKGAVRIYTKSAAVRYGRDLVNPLSEGADIGLRRRKGNGSAEQRAPAVRTSPGSPPPTYRNCSEARWPGRQEHISGCRRHIAPHGP